MDILRWGHFNRFSHLKGKIATDSVPGAGDEGDLSDDAALLSREEESPGDADVDEERPGTRKGTIRMMF